MEHSKKKVEGGEANVNYLELIESREGVSK